MGLNTTIIFVMVYFSDKPSMIRGSEKFSLSSVALHHNPHQRLFTKTLERSLYPLTTCGQNTVYSTG